MPHIKALALAMLTATTAQAEPAADLLRNSTSPGAAVAIWDGTDITTSFAGYRDLAKTAKIAADDQWHIGSNTKAMTATLVARLAEAGVITWDDTIRDTLGPVIAGINPGYDAITYTELLSHRSGIAANEGLWRRLKYARNPGPAADIQAARREYAAALLSKAPSAAGSFTYSNAGYVVVGAMLEAKTGQSWESLMQSHVFAPLGIQSAGFGAPAHGQPQEQPQGHATGLFTDCRAVGADEIADNPDYLGPAGTVHLSIRDHMRFVLAHATQAKDFLSANSWQRLHTPFGDYALGWGQNGDLLIHSGSNTMWYSIAAFDPKGWAMIANINCGDGSSLEDFAADQIAQRP